MVQINMQQREITLKIVFYGPALSGKTTNLQAIHRLMSQDAKGRLMVLDTSDDRTLFFDLMPVFFKSESGFTVKVKLFTVPGQVCTTPQGELSCRALTGLRLSLIPRLK